MIPIPGRFLIGGGIALALILSGWWWLTVHDAAQQAIGRKEVQSLWDIDKSRIAGLAIAKQAKNITDEDAARKRNEDIHAKLEAKAADAAARADLFARRLRDAEARAAANRGRVQENPGGPAILPPGQAGGGDELRRLLAEFRRECDDNADALDANYEGISPQL